MCPAYTPGTLTTPPRRVAAIAWRSALPLEPSSLRAVSVVSIALPLASKPTASIDASTPRASVRSMMRWPGRRCSSKLIGSTP